MVPYFNQLRQLLLYFATMQSNSTDKRDRFNVKSCGAADQNTQKFKKNVDFTGTLPLTLNVSCACLRLENMVRSKRCVTERALDFISSF